MGNPDFYQKISKFYDLIFGFFLYKGHRSMQNRFKQLDGERRVLEVGVGSGLTLKHYPAHWPIVGVDFSSNMLQEAEKQRQRMPNRKIELQQMDARKLSFPENSFDISYAPSLLTVVPGPEKVLQEMARVTKPGGFIYIIAHFRGESLLSRLWNSLLNRLTIPLLGFRMDLSFALIASLDGVRLVERIGVNRFLFWPLSELIVLERI